MLIEIYNDDGDFVEHKLAGVASNVGVEAHCKKRDKTGWFCAKRGWYHRGWEQSYARTDGKALDWIRHHLSYFNGEESVAYQSCKVEPWVDSPWP